MSAKAPAGLFGRTSRPDSRPVGCPGGIDEFWGLGLVIACRDKVRALAGRLGANGVELVDRAEEAAYVSVKCRDPDGYVVEAYWEPTQAAASPSQGSS